MTQERNLASGPSRAPAASSADDTTPRLKITLIRTPEPAPPSAEECPSHEGLLLAQKLINMGVPVVVCRPNPEWSPGAQTSDVLPPRGWSLIRASECDLSLFRPGVDTLAMVTGHGVDVVDVDPKNGGDVANLDPFEHHGAHETPSGGEHYLVAGTGLAKMVLATDRGHVGDYLGGTDGGGGRALAYLPGSTRPKYPESGYTVTQELDVAALEEPADEVLVAQLKAAGAGSARSAGMPGKTVAEVEHFYQRHAALPYPPCAYGPSAIEALLQDGSRTAAGDPERGRHAWAVAAATRCVDLIRAGCASSADLNRIEEKLNEIKPEGGTDWVGVVAWAIANSDGACQCSVHTGGGTEDLVARYSDFWNSSPELRTILDFARARRVSPYAVLGCCLVRVLTTVPPSVVLPPIIGGVGSLNCYVALVGPPGAGKGAAERTAGEVLFTNDIYVIGLGSGEGLNHVYMRYDKDSRKHVTIRSAALFSVPEIDSLVSLSTRSSSTLPEQLRKAWSGENLGFAYVAPDKALPVGAHTYRATLIAGVQPGRAGWLLNRVDGGLPQRFIWMPATDPGAPDELPPEPQPIDLRGVPACDRDGYTIPVPDGVKQELEQRRLSNLRGVTPTDNYNAHRDFAQLKVAAALSFLEGRRAITMRDWDRSEVIMAVSDNTLTQAQKHLQSRQADTVNRRGEEQAQSEIVKVQRLQVREATSTTLVKHLRRNGGWMPSSELRKSLASTRRELFEECITDLVEQDKVDEEVTVYNGVEGKRYRYSD